MKKENQESSHININGFREYDARWLYPKDINQEGIKNIGKGDTPLHSHRAGVSVPLTNIDVEVTLPSGEVRRVYKPAGEVAWEEPRAHKGKNLSDEPNEMILFELM